MLRHKGTVLLAKNTVVSVATFLFDLLLLWMFVSFLGMHHLLAAAVGFLIATSLHYLVARYWVFHETTRKLKEGYAYFVVNALVGLTITVGLFAFLDSILGTHFIVARVAASLVAGLGTFFLNAVLNFKVLTMPALGRRRSREKGEYPVRYGISES